MSPRPKPAASPSAPPAAAPSLGELGLSRFAPYLMNRIMGRYNAELRGELARLGLSTPKMRALAVLSVRDGLTINELAVYAVSEQSTMSRTLDQLEAASLVQREGDEADSRVRRVRLTPEGRATFERLWPALAGAEARLFEGIGPEERERFLATLDRMLRNIRRNPF